VPQPGATFQTDVTTLRRLIYRGGSLDDALDKGNVVLERDREPAARFLACFRRPPNNPGSGR
jgi:hypothetical protein